MTQDAVDLLTKWVAENVRPVPPDAIKAEAARLATEFAAYARDAGLARSDIAELEEDVAEDLKGYMENALEVLRGTDDDAPDAGEG